MPATILVTKLQTFANLSEGDRAQLNQLCVESSRFHAKDEIISDYDRPEHVHLILEGWAARFKLLPDGSRQIIGFLIPGDFCDLHITILGHMDHGIVALSPCNVAYVDGKALDRLTSENSRLTRALWWSTLVDEATLRQWVVNIGRRDAYERISHILCEMHARMKMVGLIREDRLTLPLTQEDIADATGLTPVHVNRVLQRLRKEGLIEIGSGELNVLDVSALREAGGFDASYLHINRRAQA